MASKNPKKSNVKKPNKKIKKRIKIIPIIIILTIIIAMAFSIKFFLEINVQNIFIYGNTYMNDQEIIDLAGLSDYPDYYSFSTRKIEKKLKKNNCFEKVKVTRNFFHVIKIEIVEYKVVLYDSETNNYILSSGEKVNLSKSYAGIPTLLNYVSDNVYDKFIKKLSELDSNILSEISEIKYDPSAYDEGRFFLTMNDGNYVYINLPNFKSLNLYDKVYPNFDGHKGILYFDSGYGEASEYKILK